MLSCQTLNLHIPTGRILRAHPRVLDKLVASTMFPCAGPVGWLAFLLSVVADDESYQFVAGLLGYADTRYVAQKMLLWWARGAAARCTIGRVLPAIGQATYRSDHLQLAGPFGLQP
jgi:hypothetical protein